MVKARILLVAVVLLGLLTACAQPTPAPAPTSASALESQDDVQRISPQDAKALIDEGKALLYDVRTTESYTLKHAVGAISLPEDGLESLAPTLPKDKVLILYCT